MAKLISTHEVWEASDGTRFEGETAQLDALRHDVYLQECADLETLNKIGFRKMPLPSEFYAGYHGEKAPVYVYTGMPENTEQLELMQTQIKKENRSFRQVPNPKTEQFPQRYTIMVNSLNRKHAVFALVENGAALETLASLASGPIAQKEIEVAETPDGETAVKIAESPVTHSKKTVAKTLTYQDKTLTYLQWARETGLPENTIRSRIEILHWPVEKTLTTPRYGSMKRKAQRVAV